MDYGFFETRSLLSNSEKFEMTQHIDASFDAWIEFYKYETSGDIKCWDNTSFISNACRILENYIIYNYIKPIDLDNFMIILEDVKKEDLVELYHFLIKAIELKYLNK